MTASHWIERAFSDGIPRRAAIVALVVGPVLTAINQFEALAGVQPLVWWKVALTFVVPYVVATVGALGAKPAPAGPAAACQSPAPGLVSTRESGDGDGPVKARVHVTLKPGVLDPQGKAIHNALGTLGFDSVTGVRQGKFLEIELTESDPERARQDLEAMCEKLLANTVIENYRVELDA